MRVFDAIAVRLGRALSLLFLAVVAITVFEVVSRYGFDAPTFWAHETTVALAALAFIFGGAYVMAEDGHMRITVVVDRLGPRARRWSDRLSAVVGIVYLGGLAYAMWRITDRSLFRFTADGRWNPETSGSAWNPPIPSFVNLALLLGTLLFLAIMVTRLVRLARDAFGRGEGP